MILSHVNKFFTCILLVPSMKSFLFIHHMAFSLVWSYCRSIAASKFGISATYAQEAVLLACRQCVSIHMSCPAIKTQLYIIASHCSTCWYAWCVFNQYLAVRMTTVTKEEARSKYVYLCVFCFFVILLLCVQLRPLLSSLRELFNIACYPEGAVRMLQRDVAILV